MPDNTFGDSRTAFSLIRFVSFENIMEIIVGPKTEYYHRIPVCRLFLVDQVGMSNTEVFEGIDDTIGMLQIRPANADERQDPGQVRVIGPIFRSCQNVDSTGSVLHSPG